jgi:hypothetical protein
VVGAAVVVGATVVVGAAVVVGTTVVADAAIKGAVVVDDVVGGVGGGGVSGVVGGASVGGGPRRGVVDRPGHVVTGDGAGGELSAPGVVAVVGGESIEADLVPPTAVGGTSLSRATAVVAVGLAALSTVADGPSSNPATGAPESNTIALKTALAPNTSSAKANVAISWPSGLHR